jgi:ribosome modulation factor
MDNGIADLPPASRDLFREGLKAALAGKLSQDSPHCEKSAEADLWLRGWIKGVGLRLKCP